MLALQKHYLGVHFADAPDANDKHQLGTWFRHETAFGLQGPLDAHSIPFLQVVHTKTLVVGTCMDPASRWPHAVVAIIPAACTP